MKTNSYELLVIAGTYDARILIENLNKYQISILACVATQKGIEFLNYIGVDVISGRKNQNEFENLIISKNIQCVLDASHPYADKVTKIVSNICYNINIPYIRYLRPSEIHENKDIIYAKDTYCAIDILNTIKGNILLTTGSKDLEIFSDKVLNFKDRTFVRILPTSESIKKCEYLNIPLLNIIAFGGNFSTKMNEEILKHCNAQVLVTKDSGKVGGFNEKISAAKNLGIKIIVIKRPVEYTNSMSNYVQTITSVLDIFGIKERNK